MIDDAKASTKESSDSNDYDEDPSQSSAACCIRLSLLSPKADANDNNSEAVFGPVFTHQCFPGEYIPGFAPKRERIVIDGEALKHHSSFVHHKKATHELDIQIRLAPSCQFCTVVINTKPLSKCDIEKTIPKEESVSKRRKLENNSASKKKNDDEESIELGSDDTDNEEENEDEVEGDENEEITCGPLTIDEIKEKISRALPPVVETINEEDLFLSEPIGTTLNEYSITKSDNIEEQNFSLTIADGAECLDYHNKVQSLALFYIESAEDVDVTSTSEGGYWKVMYLFQKHQKEKNVSTNNFCYSLVGYMTLYHFESPFRKPVAGKIVRICQALILPPFQRAGHGAKMLHAVFDLLVGKTESIESNNNDSNRKVVEINVEDPAPAFVAMRDRVDFERFLKSSDHWFPTHQGDENLHPTGNDFKFFSALSDADAIKATLKSFTTPRQVQIVYELDRLQKLQSFLKTNDPNEEEKEKLEKAYRLMVKHRLNRQESETLSSCSTKQEMKDMLSKMYVDARQYYCTILERLKHEASFG